MIHDQKISEMQISSRKYPNGGIGSDQSVLSPFKSHNSKYTIMEVTKLQRGAPPIVISTDKFITLEILEIFSI